MDSMCNTYAHSQWIYIIYPEHHIEISRPLVCGELNVPTDWQTDTESKCSPFNAMAVFAQNFAQIHATQATEIMGKMELRENHSKTL